MGNESQVAAVLVSILEKYLPEPQYEHKSLWHGRTVSTVADDSTDIYARLTDVRGECIIDFSYVALDDKLRGKGLFRQIVNDLKNVTTVCIREIRVSSVLTLEMRKACKALGMVEYEPIEGYRLKLK